MCYPPVNAKCWCLFSLFFLQRLVVKPDQLIKRRGKLGLVGVNLDLNGVKEWLKHRLMRETTVRHHPPSPTLLFLSQLHLRRLLLINNVPVFYSVSPPAALSFTLFLCFTLVHLVCVFLPWCMFDLTAERFCSVMVVNQSSQLKQLLLLNKISPSSQSA